MTDSHHRVFYEAVKDKSEDDGLAGRQMVEITVWPENCLELT